MKTKTKYTSTTTTLLNYRSRPERGSYQMKCAACSAGYFLTYNFTFWASSSFISHFCVSLSLEVLCFTFHTRRCFSSIWVWRLNRRPDLGLCVCMCVISLIRQKPIPFFSLYFCTLQKNDSRATFYLPYSPLASRPRLHSRRETSLLATR